MELLPHCRLRSHDDRRIWNTKEFLMNNLTTNWQALNEECIRHLRNLIRLDTSNPPGNEIIAARYMQQQVEAEELACEIVESEPGRANLHAVIKGDGTARPILLMSHLDVVPAEPEFWTH